MPAKSSLHELFGDLVVYRDLNPVDSRLPRFGAVWAELGLSGNTRPFEEFKRRLNRPRTST